MINIMLFHKANEHIKLRYLLTNMLVQRCKQMKSGAGAMVDNEGLQTVETALMEIIQEKITQKDVSQI